MEICENWFFLIFEFTKFLRKSSPNKNSVNSLEVKRPILSTI